MKLFSVRNIHQDVPTEWSCDHCDLSTVAATREDLLRRIRSHMLGNGGNVLVQQPSDGPECHEMCPSYLSLTDPAETGVLCLTKRPVARLEAWQREVGEWPRAFHLLTPSLDAPLHSRDVVAEADIADGPLSVEELDPTALDAMARSVDEQLVQLRDAYEHVAVCIGSLTQLVATFGCKPVFKFVHAMSGRFRSAGAFTHWHYTPDTQIPSTNHVIRELFQLVHDERDGERTLQTL
jgi:hypothetical protein